MDFPLYKRILSYIYPQSIERQKDFLQHEHKVDLYQDQLLLSTHSAIYSFGTRYYPFEIPFRKLKNEIPKIQTFLMLGTALGSGLKILQQKYNQYPKSILLDINPLLLDMSKKYMDLNTHHNVEWICNDAEYFIEHTQAQFDLIGIDIFTDMNSPLFVKTEDFMKKIKKRLSPNGHTIINLIYNSKNEKIIVEDRLTNVFDSVTPIPHDRNHFYICK